MEIERPHRTIGEHAATVIDLHADPSDRRG
jgi:hypothetical protein